MVKLSELPTETNLCLEFYGDAKLQMIDKGSFIQEYVEDEWEKARIAGVYLAVENPGKFDMEDVRTMIWNAQDAMGQYDDWEEDMLEAAKNAPEVENFLSYMNKLAKKHMSYEMGEEVEVDM